MTDYKVGQRLYYYDDDEVHRVEVLANGSNDDRVRYTLRVLEIVREDPRSTPPKVGLELEVEKSRDPLENHLPWRLSPVRPAD